MTNELITMVVSSVVVPLLTYAVVLLRNYLIEKTKVLQVKQAIELVADAATKAVNETSQIYVDGIKGTAKWNAEAQHDAFMQSYERLKELLSSEGYKLVEKVTGDTEAYLRAAVEEAVRKDK